MKKVGDEGTVASGSSSSTFSDAVERGAPFMAISSAVASRAMTRASSGEAGGLVEFIRLLTEERRVEWLLSIMSIVGRKEVSGESEGEG